MYLHVSNLPHPPSHYWGRKDVTWRAKLTSPQATPTPAETLGFREKGQKHAKPKAQTPDNKIFHSCRSNVCIISRRNLRARTGRSPTSKLLHRRSRTHGRDGKAASRHAGSSGG